MNEDARDGNSPTGQALGNLALLVAAPLTIAGGLYGGYRLSKAGLNAAKNGAEKFAKSSTAKKIVEGMSQDGTKYGSDSLKKETNRILDEIKLKKGDNITHNDIRDATMQAKQNVWDARKQAKNYKKENNISSDDFDFGDLDEAAEEKRRKSRHRASDNDRKHADSAFGSDLAWEQKAAEDNLKTERMNEIKNHANNPATSHGAVETENRVGPTIQNAETHTPSNEPKYGPTLRNSEHPELAKKVKDHEQVGFDLDNIPEAKPKTIQTTPQAEGQQGMFDPGYKRAQEEEAKRMEKRAELNRTPGGGIGSSGPNPVFDNKPHYEKPTSTYGSNSKKAPKDLEFVNKKAGTTDFYNESSLPDDDFNDILQGNPRVDAINREAAAKAERTKKLEQARSNVRANKLSNESMFNNSRVGSDGNVLPQRQSYDTPIGPQPAPKSNNNNGGKNKGNRKRK